MADEHSDETKIAQKIHEKARYLRGRFLNTVAVVERDIGVILTEYFCTIGDDKRELFFEKVVERIPLRSKEDILKEIMKKEFPYWWDENRGILSNFEEIRQFRNKLAHSIIDVSEEALARPINEGVGFVQWKKGQPITDNEFEDLEIKANRINSALMGIRELLRLNLIPVA